MFVNLWHILLSMPWLPMVSEYEIVETGEQRCEETN